VLIGLEWTEGRSSSEDVFQTGWPERDNFRSRLFGMFSEDVVRCWAGSSRARHACTGRPTLLGGADYATVDFTLERRSDGRRFVAEQKAEMAWMDYAYLRLERADQITHHAGKRAFDWFLEAAGEPYKRIVKAGGKVTPVDATLVLEVVTGRPADRSGLL